MTNCFRTFNKTIGKAIKEGAKGIPDWIDKYFTRREHLLKTEWAKGIKR